jgi:hypothetical protein
MQFCSLSGMQVAVTRRAEVVNDKDAADLKHHLQLAETIQSSVVKRLSGGCEGLTAHGNGGARHLS